MVLSERVRWKSKPTGLSKDDELFPRLSNDDKAHLLEDEYNIVVSSDVAPEVAVNKSSK